MNLPEVTESLTQGIDLDADIVPGLIDALIDDNASLDQKADLLRALHDKGETAAEISAFVEALLPRANDPGLDADFDDKAMLDVCGPGGGGLSIINVSTGIVFILAACGVPVVKHGNKGLTKKSGSSDVLTALGLEVSMNPDSARAVLKEVGACFLFAPAFHPAFKHLAPVRQMLAQEKRRTIFNLLGPLLNPAKPATQLIGVFRENQLDLYNDALRQLGRRTHVVVRGLTTDTTPIGEVSVLGSNQWRANLPAGADAPETWPVPIGTGTLDDLKIESPAESAQRIEMILQGTDKGLARDLLVANAATALMAQGSQTRFDAALAQAREAIDSGAALEKLMRWRRLSGNA